MIHLDNDNLEEVILATGKPVLVDMYADWCGPCKMIEPILIELDAESKGKFEIIKVNVDENPESAAKYRIRTIPTLIVFNEDGKILNQKSGAMPKNKIVELFGDVVV